METCTNDSLVISLMAQPKNARAATAKRIRELREKSGLSMDALARLVGVTKTTVQNWEMGLNGLKGKNLAELAEVLQVDMKDLMGVAASKTTTTEPRRIVYASLQRFLETRAEGQSATADERDWLASQRFPDNADLGNESWWLSQLMVFRGLRIGAKPPPAAQPLKPPGREAKRGS